MTIGRNVAYAMSLGKDIRQSWEIALLTCLYRSPLEPIIPPMFEAFRSYLTIPAKRTDDFPLQVVIKTDDFGNFHIFSKLSDDSWKSR